MTEEIQLPDEDGMEYKVVQVYVGQEETPVMRVAPLSEKSHMKILLELLKDYSIKAVPEVIGSQYLVPVQSFVQGKEYNAIGMGKCKKIDNRVYFYGFSTDYEMRIDGDHLKKIEPSLYSPLELIVGEPPK